MPEDLPDRSAPPPLAAVHRRRLAALARRPLGLGLLALIAGIVAAHGEAAWSALAPAAALLAAAAVWRRPRFLLLWAALPMVLGVALTAWALRPPPPNALAARVAAGPMALDVEARVLAMPERAPRTWHLPLRVERCAAPGQPLTPCPGDLLAFLGGRERPPLLGGERIRLRLRARPLQRRGNPGAHEYADFLRQRGFSATAYRSRQGAMEIVAPAPWTSFLSARRAAFADYVAQRYDPETAGATLALTVGLRKDLSQRLRDNFNDAGTGHLLAISGLHLGIVAAMTYAALRLLLILIPGVLRRIDAPRLTAGLTLPCVWMYAALAGFQVSTQRAALMVSVFLLARLLWRRSDGLNSLFLAAWALLLWDPFSLSDVGFQLSFLSVAAIFFIVNPLARLLEHQAMARLAPSPLVRASVRYVSFLCASSLACFAATLPVVLIHFGRLAPVAPLANLFAVPITTLGALPLFASGMALGVLGLPGAGPLLDGGVALLNVLVGWQQALIDAVSGPWHPIAPIGFAPLWWLGFLALRQRRIWLGAAALLLALALVVGASRREVSPAAPALRVLDLDRARALLVLPPAAPAWLVWFGEQSEARRTVTATLDALEIGRGLRAYPMSLRDAETRAALDWLMSIGRAADIVEPGERGSLRPPPLPGGTAPGWRAEALPLWPDDPRVGAWRLCQNDACALVVPHADQARYGLWRRVGRDWRADVAVLGGPMRARDLAALVEETGVRQVVAPVDRAALRRFARAEWEQIEALDVCLWRSDRTGSVGLRPAADGWRLEAPRPPPCALQSIDRSSGATPTL